MKLIGEKWLLAYSINVTQCQLQLTEAQGFKNREKLSTLDHPSKLGKNIDTPSILFFKKKTTTTLISSSQNTALRFVTVNLRVGGLVIPVN